MSKPKVWTLPALLDRIWAAIPISNKTAVICDKDAAAQVEACGISLSHLGKFGLQHAFKRVVTGWDEDYKPRTYELNKISAASAAALYERIKTMREEGKVKQAAVIDDVFEAGRQAGRSELTPPTIWNKILSSQQLEPPEPRKPCGCPPEYCCPRCANWADGVESKRRI